MTVTPSISPNTVTTFLPQPVETPGGASTVPVPSPSDTTGAVSSGVLSPSVSDPALSPTALPDQGTSPLAYAPAISTTTTVPDGGNVLVGGGIGGLGDSPTTAAPSPGTTAEGAPSEAPQGMDPMAERAMISVGSIAAFVMIVSIVWLVFRRVKKRKQNGESSSSTLNFHKFWPRGLTFRSPLKIRNRDDDRPWENLGDSKVVRDRPPTYSSEKAAPKKSIPLGGFYGHEKGYSYHAEDEARQDKPQLPRLQTTGIPAAPPIPTHTPSSARPLSSHPVSALSSNPVSAAKSTRGDISAHTMASSNVLPFSHSTQDSFSSTNAAQFGTMTAITSTGQLRPDIGHGYYNQSDLARAPSERLRRQGNRNSELSSLSSGFGDGDIIVPGVAPPVPQIPPNAYPGTGAPAPNGYPRFSWMSQEPSKRDTVYTQASEDQPPRFRSVNSWVDQQTGRIKRAQQQPQSSAPPVLNAPGVVGIPGIHNPPDEVGFEMMMDDEKPRRVEDTLPRR
ncbi:hypothetical protein B0T16DRAFT_413905 [Cercophora newfieldiana]|uniref:Uncharacterized protein n=1 Tax=Cercophora newfieldiana TaxID=92897 RepID=A0AA39Y756_9PEZI|nr:hypothetical protein B0T16DRAFT_413905 [Cercophora newfieldiana]